MNDPIVPQQDIPKVVASGLWGMAKNLGVIFLDFAVRMRGFTAIESSGFLCVFAPLREHIPFRETYAGGAQRDIPAAALSNW